MPYRISFHAAAAAAVLLFVAARAQTMAPPVLTDSDLPAIIRYALAHQGNLGPFTGRHFKITGYYSHMDRFNDYAAASRPDNARSFEIAPETNIAVPRVMEVTVGCLLPKDHPFAKIADSVALGVEPAAFANGTFTLEGNIDNLDFEPESGDTQLNLGMGCAVN